jgi:hypothetical protein
MQNINKLFKNANGGLNVVPQSTITSIINNSLTYTSGDLAGDIIGLQAFYKEKSNIPYITSAYELLGFIPPVQSQANHHWTDWGGTHYDHHNNFYGGDSSVAVFWQTALLFKSFPDVDNNTSSCQVIQSYISGLQNTQLNADKQFAADNDKNKHDAITTAITKVSDYYNGLNSSLACSTYLAKKATDEAAAAEALKAKQAQQLEIETAQAGAKINQGAVSKSPTMYALYGLGAIAIIVVGLVAVKILKD